jgi:arginine/lysine/ornithine decarboxylase
MASIDSCICQLAEHGGELFEDYIRILCSFREQARFEHIELLQTDDPSRILLKPRNMSARKLYEILRGRYHLQPEMLARSYVLMLTSVSDSREGFDRLLQALREIDELPPLSCQELRPDKSFVPEDIRSTAGIIHTVCGDAAALPAGRPVIRIPVSCALNSPQGRIAFHEAAGCISAEYLYLYPPGVPLLAPGEEITPGLIALADDLTEEGYELQGTEDYTHSSIWIVKEDI